jgi:nucleobase:cation symporter-1, NCS1 family
MSLWIPSMRDLRPIFPASWNLETGPFVGFVIFWVLNVLVVFTRMDGIKRLLNVKATVLLVTAVVVMGYALWVVGGFKGLDTVGRSRQFPSRAAYLNFFFGSVTGVVGSWTTLALNIPDFTR